MATNLQVAQKACFALYLGAVCKKTRPEKSALCYIFQQGLLVEIEGKMEDFLGISYKLSKSENFEEYMKALGVGLVTRKIGNSVSPSVKLTKSEDKYTFLTLSTFKNNEITFKIGETFKEETPDGRKVDSVITIDGNKMVHIQKDDKSTTTIEREFTKEQMTAIFTIGDIVCTRVYDRVNN